MGKCKICKRESALVSDFLGVCKACILKGSRKSFEIVREAHERARNRFGLEASIPKAADGLQCFGCGNECKIPTGEKGYCGLVENRGKLVRLAGTNKGLCEWYYDVLPTNCVATEFCPASTGCGYPEFAKHPSGEYGYYNLSVFYGACNLNCLFCQNWQFKNLTKRLSPLVTAFELADKVNEKVTCVCFFGGDPNPQLQHAIQTSELALKVKPNDILRICLETNGNANWKLLKKFAKISFSSGGCIKFDLKLPKASPLAVALTGVSNIRAYENFEKLVEFHKRRANVPFLVASTLLIPGYVGEPEVREISQFIADLDPTIPYSLLAFYPSFMLTDLPRTTKKLAEKCLKAAREEGLERVRVGNMHLLV